MRLEGTRLFESVMTRASRELGWTVEALRLQGVDFKVQGLQ